MSRWGCGDCARDCISAIGDASDLFVDDPYDAKAWRRHASWARHLPQPSVCLRLFRSYFLFIELWIISVTVGTGMWYTFAQAKEGYPIAVSAKYALPFTLTSFAVSLLLVFRTNSAYDRWWEARKAFGLMLNHVRNISRMAAAAVPPDQRALLAMLLTWTAVLPHATTAYISEDASHLSDIGSLLPGEAVRQLERERTPPVAVLQVISELLRRARMTDIERVAIEAHLSAYDVSVGACERLRSQPVPLAYTRHTSRFILTWLSFLPFALWEYLEWLCIPTMVVLTFLLLGIENIAVQIEQPFRVLPLRRFAQTCREAVLEMQGRQAAVSATVDEGLEALQLQLDMEQEQQLRPPLVQGPPRTFPA